MWDDVQVRTLPPAELSDRRNASIQRYHEREEQRFKESVQKKREQDTYTLRQQMEVDQQKRNFIEKTHETILNEERKVLASEMQKLGQKDTAIKNKKADVAPTSFRAQLKESIFEEDDCEEIYTPGA